MKEIPAEWIDKLFDCMKEFYEARWTNQFVDEISLQNIKKIWQHGLQGLEYEDIKHTLRKCKLDGANKRSEPPNVMEFFYYTKGLKPFVIKPATGEDYNKEQDKEVYELSMKEIRKALGLDKTNLL